jgi:hypothetical protein
MAHHDHNHRNHQRRNHLPAKQQLVWELRQRAQIDADNTAPQLQASLGLWNLAMSSEGHLTATYSPTGDTMILAQAPVPPPPSTTRAAYSSGVRGAGQGQASPALLALIGGLPTSLPEG